MIPRLYDVDEGDVMVDGVSVKEYSLKNLRNGVSMVLQKNVLSVRSISVSSTSLILLEDATALELCKSTIASIISDIRICVT